MLRGGTLSLGAELNAALVLDFRAESCLQNITVKGVEPLWPPALLANIGRGLDVGLQAPAEHETLEITAGTTYDIFPLDTNM